MKHLALILVLAPVLLTPKSPMTGASGPQQTAPNQPSPPEARAADVASIDALMAAVYDVISGAAGDKRDWNRFRSFFVPGARLVPTRALKDGSGYGTRVLSPEEYINHGESYFEKNGFFEKETSRRTEQYGNIAQVWSTYESRHAARDPNPFERGINSFQLMNDGKRWWVVTIFWQGEDPSHPIPDEYLKRK
jgi:hypothetical protein